MPGARTVWSWSPRVGSALHFIAGAFLAAGLAACSSPQALLQGGAAPLADGGSVHAATTSGRSELRALVTKRIKAERKQDTYANRDLGAAPAAAAASVEKVVPIRSVGGTGPFDEAQGAAPAQPTPARGARIVRVFYATTRALEGTYEALEFTATRGEGLSRGFADVSIPPVHKLGAIERPAVWRFQAEDESRHVVVRTIYTAEVDYFRDILSEHATSTDRRAIVYVHGFATSFSDALRRTAQLKYDLAFKGPVVLFSWPSAGNPLSYPADQANAEWSQGALSRFVLELMQTEALSEVTVIAFSMGAKVTTAALAEATGKLAPAQVAKLQNIVLAAPDIDRDVFIRDLLPRLRTGGGRITLYASEKDRALEASRRYHKVQRLGSLRPQPTIAAGLDTIDATRVDTSLTGHAYYGDNRSVVSDLFYLINEKLPPGRRATLRAVSSPQGAYWTFAN